MFVAFQILHIDAHFHVDLGYILVGCGNILREYRERIVYTVIYYWQ